MTCFVCGLVMKELEKLVNMSNIEVEYCTVDTCICICIHVHVQYKHCMSTPCMHIVCLCV